MGLGSSLIYPPAFFAKKEELIELAKVVGEYAGMYISQMRSEGNNIEEAVQELSTIVREAGVPTEIYHLKFSGKPNIDKFDSVMGLIEAARAEGLRITADMYTYVAGAKELAAVILPWASDGGTGQLLARLDDPDTRARIVEEMRTPTDAWENLLMAAGAEGVLLADFGNPELREYVGKPLAEVAAMRGMTAEEAAADLVLEDSARTGAIYFIMSEDNMRRKVALPWLSFGSDAAAAPDGDLLNQGCTRAPTATSPDCSVSTSGKNRPSASRRRSANCRPCRRTTSALTSADACAPGTLPMWWSSPRRS